MTTTNEKLRNVAEIAARIMMGEKALHPNQQKLDVHEPEKDELTAKDFEKLRAGKKAEVKKEEVEQIDELSTDTMKSYVKGAKMDVSAQKDQKASAVDQGDHKTASDSAAAIAKRQDGIKQAKSKMNKEEIIDRININEKKKYLIGTYDIEILTLPRISIQNLRIKQSETTTIKIPAPGLLTVLNTNAVPVFGSIYVEKGQDLEWVCDINGNSVTETITLQPGNYHIVYKNKGSKKTMSTRSERFTISSGSSYSIRF